LSNVTVDNILDLMKGDWLKAFESPLIVSEAEERSLYGVSKAGIPHIVYAAWQYYLEDDWMHERGTAGVDQFVRHVTRYTMKVGKGMKRARAARVGEQTLHIGYSCKTNAVSDEAGTFCEGGNDVWFYTITFKPGHGVEEGEKLPLYHEMPCPVCNGPCIMNYDFARQFPLHRDVYPIGWIDPGIAESARKKGLAGVIGDALKPMESPEPPPPAPEPPLEWGEGDEGEIDFF
jgi:hypothetical protein